MSTNLSFQNYQTYLKIEELLSLQQPLYRAHDETPFIIVHQVYELWFKCMLHELEHSGGLLSEDQPDRAASSLKHVANREDARKPARRHGDDDAA